MSSNNVTNRSPSSNILNEDNEYLPSIIDESSNYLQNEDNPVSTMNQSTSQYQSRMNAIITQQTGHPQQQHRNASINRLTESLDNSGEFRIDIKMSTDYQNTETMAATTATMTTTTTTTTASTKTINSPETVLDVQNNDSDDELHDRNNIDNETDTDDNECDDLNEPKFTYDRIGNHFSEIIEKDSATCLTLHERFLALGTKSGKVLIFDFQGNIVAPPFPTNHRQPVNAISIDEKGEYIASCSDYQLIIVELYPNENIYVTTFDRPVKTVSIDPAFANTNFRRFTIGEADRMLFFEKNILGRYKSTCLQQARGVIRRSTWRTHFIAWASDLGIKIYDSTNRTIITHIDRQKTTDYRIKSDIFQASFCWKDNLTLLICWGTSIKMCCIKQRTNDSMSSLRSSASDSLTPLPKFYVELVYAFNIENNLIGCGIAPYENRFKILCTNKQIFVPEIDTTSGSSINDNAYCRVKMVEPLNADIFNDLSDDILQPKDFLKSICSTRDITMSYLATEQLYFILCPHDLILAKQRDEDEHINWLMSRGNFEHAMARVEHNIMMKKYTRHTVVSVGTEYIQHLFHSNSYNHLKTAANLLEKICDKNQTLWEREIMRFKQKNALRLIANKLPTGPEVLLDKAMYELVLKEYLQHDSIGYLELIRKWPPTIYSSVNMINATIEINAQSQDINLQEALGELYTNERQYRQALFIFLQVGNSKKVFDLIYQHRLLYLLEDRIIQLLELEPEETSRLLIANQDSIPAEKVITKLQQHPKLLCSYLDRLFHRDPQASSQYHNLMFDLYCTYLPDKVVPLLRQSNFIQLDKALEACRKRKLPKAVVFILGRMGAAHEALRIIIEQMNDINYAIEFCREHGDPDLWSELMDISVSKGELLSKLLQEVSTYAADPIGLIARIPEKLEVPNLMQSLVKILHDYRLQVTLENGCCTILRTDCYNLLERFNRLNTRALSVKHDTVCQCCQREVLEFDPKYANDVCLFQCGHVFHSNCLMTISSTQASCTVCRTQVNRTNE